jgi:hypothetical protein
MKKPVKPKFKAMPKAPKMSASKDAWKNYETKVKSITAENQKIKSEYEKKLKAFDAEMKARERIKEKAKNANR